MLQNTMAALDNAFNDVAGSPALLSPNSLQNERVAH